MKKLLILALLAYPASGAYSFLATATIPAASGAAQANDTLVITGADPYLKTLANGGHVLHTVTRNGITVPADLVVGSNASCSSLYSFDVAAYDGVTSGTVIIWLLMPSHSASASTTVYVCLGNAAVATYQGGAAGGAWNSAYQVFHLGEASNPYYDSASGSHNSTGGTYPSQATGHIGKAQSFVTAGSQFISAPSNELFGNNMTYLAWVKSSSTQVSGLIDDRGNAGHNGTVMYLDASGRATSYRNNTGAINGSVDLADGNWHQLIGTYASIHIVQYVDGVSVASGGANPYAGEGGGTLYLGSAYDLSASFLNGLLEEVEIFDGTWDANRVATIYGNQLNPPVISAFSGSVTVTIRHRVSVN